MHDLSGLKEYIVPGEFLDLPDRNFHEWQLFAQYHGSECQVLMGFL